jgi:hypothetical protein
MSAHQNLKKLIKALDCASERLEKEEKTINYSALPSTKEIEQANTKKKESEKARIGVTATQSGQAPRLSGVANKYEMGRTSTGKTIHSHFDNKAHEGFTAKEHGEAAKMHKDKRDDFRTDKGVNPALAEHHHNMAMAHSKAQADALRMGKSEDFSAAPKPPAPAHINISAGEKQGEKARNMSAAPKPGQIKPSHQKFLKSVAAVANKKTPYYLD